ncbi:CCA tRNA nucleotidyltransferase [Peptoniphilus sp.]|uniref:CCA tRNA nucleotidyltransferase n=1 Tax=Peptoniphilus sp. TaxID=1971214 RepID=UPI0039921042
MKNIISDELMDLFNILNSSYESYFVGGAVRDMILGYSINDYDITTLATPDEIRETLHMYKTIDIGGSLGTVLARTENFSVDITPFRIEGEYKNYRKPEEVIFSKDVRDDIKRRDFTINAILYNGEFIDYVGGIEDLKNKIIRAIGDPEERIKEDALRILRAVRFASKYDFEIEDGLKSAIISNVNLLENISYERIRDEFVKILLDKNVKLGINLLKELHILDIILPEIVETYDYDQNSKYHENNLYDHILNVVGYSPEVLEIRLAALLHDLGKPSTFSMGDDGVAHYYGHEVESSEIARKVLRRFKFSNETIKNVRILIENHMTFQSVMTDRALRRQIRKVGSDNILNLYDLMVVDRLGTMKSRSADDIFERRDRVEELLKEPTSKPKFLNFGGSDLIEMGFTPGPEFKKILNELTELVLDDPSLNTNEKLRQIVERNYNG